VVCTPSCNIDLFDDIRPSIKLKLPKVPFFILQQIIALFKYFCNGFQVPLEAMAQIYWDRYEQRYVVSVPYQKVGPGSVDTVSDAIDEERYLLFADVHSHNVMRAFFSKTDDEDDKAVRVYVVIGKVNNPFPEIKARVSNGDSFINISVSDIFELDPSYLFFPAEWLDKISAIGKEEKGETKKEEFEEKLKYI